MEIFDEKKGLEWLSSFGVKNLEEESINEAYKNSTRFFLPEDSGVKTCLSRLICKCVRYDKKVCLWIIERGIFPSQENLNLFYGYRKYLGESRKVEEAPCHLFLAADVSILESILALSLYFIWDVVVFDPVQKIAFWASHDEIFIIYAKNEDKIKELENIFKDFKLRLIT